MNLTDLVIEKMMEKRASVPLALGASVAGSVASVAPHRPVPRTPFAGIPGQTANRTPFQRDLRNFDLGVQKFINKGRNNVLRGVAAGTDNLLRTAEDIGLGKSIRDIYGGAGKMAGKIGGYFFNKPQWGQHWGKIGETGYRLTPTNQK